MKKNYALIAAAILPTTFFAEELQEAKEVEQLPEVAVTANRVETDVDKINRTITVITREEIEQKQSSDLLTLLSQTPGIDVRRTGKNSRSSSVMIRGMQSFHTKVLVDGVAIQDTSTPQTTPIFPSISLENIERIEIIRGAASTLYGSNAIGGVINIITRKAGEDSFNGQLGTEFGSHGYQDYNAFINGKKGKFDYNFGANWTSERGISSQKTNSENDPSRELNFQGKMGYQLTDKLKLSAFANYATYDQEYDGYMATIGDWHIVDTQLGLALDAKDLLDKMLDMSFRYSYTDTKRHDEDYGYDYKGVTNEFDWQNTIKINDTNRLILGMTYTDEYSDNTSTVSTNWTQAYFAQYETEPIENLTLTSGIRYNDHSVFGNETTYSASASYYIEATETRLRTSWATGYRAPSLYELNDPSYGNSDLTPEESESWDIGFEQTVNNDIDFGVTYFRNKTTDSIEWVWPSGYSQVDGIKITGVETYINYRATDDLTLNFSHTYQRTEDEERNVQDLQYRPNHKFTAMANWQVNDRLNLNINGNYVDSRSTSNGGQKSLHGYTLVNIAATYKLTDDLQIYGKIDNLLDQDYEEAVGYNTYGITTYVGMKYSF